MALRVVLFTGAVCLAALPALADLAIPPVAYPTLAANAPSLDGFVPRGWKVESKSIGDLNGDGLPDIAFVLRETSPANILDASNDGGEKNFNTNPRILAVVLARAGGVYDLALSNHALIPRTTETSMDDYFDPNGTIGGGMEIKGGALHVRLGVFASSGSWDMGPIEYTFRFQNGRFVLIGYDNSDTDRGSGKMKDVSIDYLSGRVKISTGNISSDTDKVAWKHLRSRAMLTADQIGDGVNFDPLAADATGK